MRFYLGCDVAGLSWGVPAMVSHGRLRSRKRLPRATAPWVCDSRGFSELSQHGKWTFGPDEYTSLVRRYRDEIGLMEWASPQDWMCEPSMIAKTGLSVREHQVRTVENLLELRATAPDLVFIPVLQGWALDDYLRCIDMYGAAGMDLRNESTVGLGSVCRRQATGEIHGIVSVLEALGIMCHGFGIKTAAIAAIGPLLASADSFAWSYGGRRAKHCDHGCTEHAANCPACALSWRERVLAGLGWTQPALPVYTDRRWV